MNCRVARKVILFSFFSVVVLAAPAVLPAQETQGPLPATPPQAAPLEPGPLSHSADGISTKPMPPRTSIVGAWKLNTDQSDDGRQKLEQAQAKSQKSVGGSGNPRMGGGSPYPGGGNPNPGGAGNPYPSGGGLQGGMNQISDADRS